MSHIKRRVRRSQKEAMSHGDHMANRQCIGVSVITPTKSSTVAESVSLRGLATACSQLKLAVHLP
jgi:hypothetical protein